MYNEVNVPIRGLNLDSIPTDTEKDSYTYALNAIVEDITGNHFKISNEHSNTFSAELTGRNILGGINLLRDEIIIFSSDGSYSYIGSLKGDNYEDIIRSSDLAFNNKIKGEFKTVQGCERVIIFNDYDNPDRLVNLDRLELYTVGNISPQEANQNDLWDVNEMRLQPIALEPSIELQTINDSGGTLVPGTYAFQVEYVNGQGDLIARSPISKFAPIYQESIGAGYESKFGNYNIDIRTADAGGIPPTNKSITLTITGLDNRFDFIRINAIAFTSGEGITPSSHTVNQLIPISDTVSFTYRGFSPSRGDFEVELGDLNTFPIIYESSFTLTQVDNRLVRANLKEQARDYSSYQRVVNNITVKPSIKQVDAKSSTDLDYYKSASLAGGEIYMVGIRFLHENSAPSPVFHIHGRDKIPGLDDVTVTPGPNTQHLPEKDSYEYWEVFNTGNADRLGYFELDATYPETVDCEGEYIYGDLAGTPIRPVYIPSRREIPIVERLDNQIIQDDERYNANIIGLEFDNIEYPEDDIIGHQFVIVPRTNDTKTVLDTGFLFGSVDEDGVSVFSAIRGNLDDDTIAGLISPKSVLGRYENGTHVELLERVASQTFVETQDGREYPVDDSNAEIEIQTFAEDIGHQRLSNANGTSVNRTISSYGIISPRSINRGTFSSEVRNDTYSNPITVLELEEPVSINNQFPWIVSIRSYKQPYSNLANLSYRPMHNDIRTLQDEQVVYGGDVFISAFRMFSINKIGRESGGELFERDYQVNANFLYNLFFESEINTALLTSGTGDNEKFEALPDPSQGIFHPYLVNKVAVLLDNDEWQWTGNVVPEFYDYNPDYSNLLSLTEYFPIPQFYNYCSDCIGLYPNRVVWSNRSFPEEITENYRVFLTENFTSVGINTGMITGLHYDKNRMLVRTMQSMFQMAPNPQEVQTDIDSAYLGTGDFLSIPPNEMVKTNYGYGGGQGRFDYIPTEHGLVTVDGQAGQIFLFSGSNGNELSSDKYKCRKWFRRNLTGDGKIILSYDPVFKRLILTKKGEEKKHFTISFSFNQNGWCSFHSYLPDFMLHDINGVLHIKDDKIYRPDYYSMGVFFEEKYPHIIEYVVTNMVTSDLECIHYYAQTLQWNESEEVWVDVDEPTYNKLWVYTDQQSTGIQSLTYLNKQVNPWGNRISWSNTEKDVVHAEQNYRICGIRDLAVSTPVSTSAFESIQDQYPIDKISNDSNIDYQRSQWNLIQMKDKYFRVRLYFEPVDNYKIIFNLSSSILNQSQL